MQRDRSTWLHGQSTPCQVEPVYVPRVRRIILLGAPGVGKGTQARLLSQAYGACHLSTGDVFRASADQPGFIPHAARGAMHSGEFVADNIVIGLIRERVQCLSCRGGFLLDGFPRTLEQARVLDDFLGQLGLQLDATVDFELPEGDLLARTAGRRTCPKCHAIYHLAIQPPIAPGLCDHCGALLELRDDDRPEAMSHRLSVYLRTAEPLRDYYRSKGLLTIVSAAGTPDEVFNRTIRALG